LRGESLHLRLRIERGTIYLILNGFLHVAVKFLNSYVPSIYKVEVEENL
jgi:hypothetical protein